MVDKISYVIDATRTRFGYSQAAITRDNVSVEVRQVHSVQDPERPRTGRSIRSHSVTQQHAQSHAIGDWSEWTKSARSSPTNATHQRYFARSFGTVGLEIRRYEITEVSPISRFESAMTRGCGERARREQVSGRRKATNRVESE
jgi:hypothetical protein